MELHRVTFWRLVRGLSGQELAKRAGIQPHVLSRVERSRVEPRELTKERIAGALHMPVEAVFPQDKEKP